MLGETWWACLAHPEFEEVEEGNNKEGNNGGDSDWVGEGASVDLIRLKNIGHELTARGQWKSP